MSTEVGAIHVDFFLNDKDFNRGISSATKKTKQFENTADQAGKKSQKSFNKFSESIKGLGKNIPGIGSGLDSISLGAAGVAGAVAVAGAALVRFGAAASAQGARLEQQIVAMTTLLDGNKEAATSLIDSMNALANRTPLENSDLIQGAKLALQFGKSVEEAQAQMTMFADVAAGSGLKVAELSQIFNKAIADNKVQTDELNQLIERGAIDNQALAKNLGVTTDQIFDMASKGKITGEVLTKTFQDMTSEGGKFFQMADKQSATFSGLMSTISGVSDSIMADIGLVINEAIKPFLSIFIAGLNKLKEIIQPVRVMLLEFMGAIGSAFSQIIDAIPQGLKDFIATIAKMAASILLLGPAGIVIVKLAQNFNKMAPVFRQIKIAFGSFISAIKQVFAELSNAGQQIADLILSFAPIRELFEKIKSLFEESKGGVSALTIALRAMFFPIANGITLLAAGIRVVIESVKLLFGILKELAKTAINVFRGMALAVKGEWSQAWAAMKSATAEGINGLASRFRNFGGSIVGIARDTVNKTRSQFASIFDSSGKAANNVKKLVKSGGKANTAGIEKVAKKSEEAKKKTDAWENSLKKLTEKEKGFASFINTVASGISSFLSVMNQAQQAAMNLQQARVDQVAGIGDILLQMERQRVEEEVKAVEDAEKEKTRIIKGQLAEREAALDAELQKKLEQIDADIESQKEALIASNEAERAAKEEQAASEAEILINNSIFKSDLEDAIAAKEEERARLKEEAIAEAERKKAEEKAKADEEIKKSEEEKNKRIEQLRQENLAKEKQAKKAIALMNWLQQLAGFKLNQQVQYQQAVISAFTASANVLSSLSMIPLIGPFIAIPAAAAALAAGLSIASSIRAMPPPLPPAELFLSGGGVISGPGTSTSDSIPARLSSGEAVIDASRTEKLINNIDGMGKRVEVNISQGAFVVGNMDERMVEFVSEQIAREVEARL